MEACRHKYTHYRLSITENFSFFSLGPIWTQTLSICLMTTNHSSVGTKQNRVKLNNTTINCAKVNLQFITITCFPTQRPSLFTRNNDSLLHATVGAHTHTKKLSNMFSLHYCGKTDKSLSKCSDGTKQTCFQSGQLVITSIKLNTTRLFIKL